MFLHVKFLLLYLIFLIFLYDFYFRVIYDRIFGMNFSKLPIVIIVMTIVSSLLFSQSIKSMTFGSAVVERVISIYDGDTFRADIKGYPPIVGKRMAIRINGIDTPELKARCEKEKILARAAKKVTVNMLRNAHKIELRNIKRGKYFRLIADVYVDGKSLGEELITKHLAVRYFGGTKVDWCR